MMLCLVALAAGGCALDSGGTCDCLVRDPAIVVQVQDASTHAAIAAPTFMLDGDAVQAACGTTDAPDPAATACAAWWIYAPSGGAHVVAIPAPGYASQTIAVTIPAPTTTDCCPIVNDAHASVALALSP
jgi:hypothetical protein